MMSTNTKYINGLTSTIISIFTTAANGVRAEYMQSCFPTKTFPNHYTLVTVSASNIWLTILLNMTNYIYDLN